MDNSNQKKILIDTTFLFDQYSRRGIGKTGRELVVRLIPLLLENNYEVHLIGFETLEKNLIDLGFSQFVLEDITSKIHFKSFGPAVVSGVRNIWRWNKTYKAAFEEINPDIFFAAHYERGLPSANIFKNRLADNLKKMKTCVICYDVIPFKTGKYSNKGFIRNIIKMIFNKILWTGVKNADLIFTISNFSKEEISSMPDINAEKIRVIHLGISDYFYKSNIQMRYDDELINQVMEVYSIEDKKYFLYDSGIENNKGIFELLETFAKLQTLSNSKIPKYLVITGGDFVKSSGKDLKGRNIAADKIIKKARELGIIENLIVTGKVSERDLVILLHKASFYINFSKYEGFGLGIAQSFAAEIPVIASNLSSYPEIAQNAGFLVDISDLNQAVKDIESFISNDNLIKLNIEKGVEVVKGYDWDQASKKYFEEMNNLIIDK